MKIAVNCAFYQRKGGGIKEYIDNLIWNISKLPHTCDLLLYVLQDQYEFAKENLPGSLRIKKIPFNSVKKYDRIKRSLLEQKFWSKEEKIEKFDLFHSPFFHSPRFKKAKVLLTVHDLRLYRFPHTYEFFRYNFLKRKVRKSIMRADHIISISEFTKNEIKELIGYPEEKITVILEAINRNRFSIDEGFSALSIPNNIKPGKFILTVGHMEPRKNYARLIEAFGNLTKRGNLDDYRLVIVGRKDHSYGETLKLIENTPNLTYLDFVDGHDLLWLYHNASLFVFPSYYEGFGFPPLEAGSLGTVSAVSNVSSIPEVCADAAVYFNPYDVDDMTDAMEKALTDKDLIEGIKVKMERRLGELSWEKNAAETLKVYDKMVK